jgi:hypothetical protein
MLDILDTTATRPATLTTAITLEAWFLEATLAILKVSTIRLAILEAW